MGSKYIRKHLMPSLMAAMFLFLSACQGTSRDVEGRIAKAGKEGEGKVQGRTPEDAVLKTHAKEQSLILPFLERAVPAFKELGVDKKSSWSHLVKVKNWYMGDQSVSDKFNGLISITRFNGGNEILAHQTQYEVFINTLLFNKLEKSAQDDAVLEEFLTSLYSLKHLDKDQHCKLVREVYGVKDCKTHAEDSRNLSESDESIEELPADEENGIVGTDLESKSQAKDDSKKEEKNLDPRQRLIKEKSLRSDEVVDIQNAAKYLKTLPLGSVVTQEVITTLKSHKFDVRIFDYELGLGNTTAATGKKISVEEGDLLVSEMAKAAEKELSCSYHGSEEKPQKCKLAIEQATDEKTKAKWISLKIEVDGKKLAEDNIILSAKDGEIGVGEYTPTGTKEAFILVPVATAALPVEKRKEGTVYRGYYLVATTAMKFVGIYSAPGIVKSIVNNENEKGITCTGAAYFSAESPGIFASSIDKTLPEEFTKRMNPVAPCY